MKINTCHFIFLFLKKQLWNGDSPFHKGLSLGLKALAAVTYSQFLFTKPIIKPSPKEEKLVESSDIEGKIMAY